MNVLSLFDGMSCGQIALNRIGIKPTKYYASEIDKHAMTVSKANYPDTIYVGDVTKWKEWDIDWSSIDLLLAGSPCQGFSMAGKQLAFDDPRSALFFVFIDIWEHIQKNNPKAHYLLENVRMKQEHENVISRILDIKPIIINSALVSAQNRVRLYWTNIHNQKEGLFGFNYCAIPQPQDKGILLKDVLEDQVDDKYYLSDKLIQGFERHAERHAERGNGFKFEPKTKETEKGNCLNARMHKMGADDNYIITHSTQPRTGKGQGGKGHLMKQDQRSYCLDTGNSQAIEIVAMRGRNPENPKSRESGLPTKQMLEARTDGKTNCITTVQKDNLVRKVNQLNKSIESGGKQPYQHNRVYSEYGLMTALDTDSGRKSVQTQSNIRRLTPIECERLQTVPDNYTAHVSDTQRYKMLGNGWTVDVICHILRHLN